MKFNELYGRELTQVTEGFIDPNEDEFLKADPEDSRKPRLTLRQINKLKKIRATNELENAKKESLLGVMYGAPPEDDDSGF
jgi:hypothetical protein